MIKESSNYIESDVLILGAGLTGLTLAYRLRNSNIKVTLVEARGRIGGRINTIYGENGGSQEMGATWLGRKHISLIGLLKELELDTFIQILGDKAVFEPISTSPPQVVSLPPNSDPSFRIKGGTSNLINTLASHLSTDQIITGQPIQSIRRKRGEFFSKSADKLFRSKIVVSTLPPFLLIQTIEMIPEIPSSVRNIAYQTHTWMGESIKVGLTYKSPFWRGENTSGTIVSNVGPIPEMYDHSNFEETAFGLKGFFNGSYFSVTKEERLALVLKQLEKYYGPQVKEYLTYEETVWRNEPYTFNPYESHLLPHQNNGNPEFRKACFGGQFYVAGSETAKSHPGYMDGAVSSADFVFEELKGRFIV